MMKEHVNSLMVQKKQIESIANEKLREVMLEATHYVTIQSKQIDRLKDQNHNLQSALDEWENYDWYEDQTHDTDAPGVAGTISIETLPNPRDQHS